MLKITNIVYLLAIVSQTTALFQIDWGFDSDESQCYTDPPVGCFVNTGHFRNTGNIRPESPQTIGVRFVHYSASTALRFTFNQTSQVISYTFDPNLRTAIIIHGYFESATSRWVAGIARRLLNRERMNVFAIDWPRGANRIIYPQSAANTKMVGAITALFLEQLIASGGSPSTFHLIGFSLGAHIAGQAGKRVPGIGRITGLDPAGPCFEGYDPVVRLHHTDADFVDVVHTDTRTLFEGGKGMATPCGHVDFYPNGGRQQPGCPNGVVGSMRMLLSRFEMLSTGVIKFLVGCEHSRAFVLFSSSVSHDCQYQISQCSSERAARYDNCSPCSSDDCPTFGYDLTSTNGTYPSGIYRFSTSNAWPYC